MVVWLTDSLRSDLKRFESFVGLVGEPTDEAVKSRRVSSTSASLRISLRAMTSRRYVCAKSSLR